MNIEKLKIFFIDPLSKIRIAVMLNIPHMLKLVRNTFSRNKVLQIPGFEYPALWRHTELLLAYEEKKQMAGITNT